MQQRGDDINRRERDPRAVREEINAIHRGEPFVLERLHPKDAPRRSAWPRTPESPTRMKAHLVRAKRVARHVLPQRPVAQPRREQPPHAEECRRHRHKSGASEHRPARADQFIARRQVQPSENFCGEKNYWDEQNRQPWNNSDAMCSQKRRMPTDQPASVR